MDINRLLFRQQVETSLADAAGSRETSLAHTELAALYTRMIERRRQAAALGIFD